LLAGLIWMPGWPSAPPAIKTTEPGGRSRRRRR
jgi:hypothetical protein